MKLEDEIIRKVAEGYELSPKAARAISRAHEAGTVIRFCVLSCPDYTSRDDKYTFGELGEGVPLLTRFHSDGVKEIANMFGEDGAEIEVLIADVEAENPHLVGLYTGGDYDEYHRRCESSTRAIKEYLRIEHPGLKTVSSSFIKFPKEANMTDEFMHVRDTYAEMLKERFDVDSNLTNIVLRNVRNKIKSGYYKSEYGGAIGPSEQVDQELVTMAEYLTLGLLIGKRAVADGVQPVIVVHSGNNNHLFNAVRSFEPEKFGFDRNLPKIPILELTKSVVGERE